MTRTFTLPALRAVLPALCLLLLAAVAACGGDDGPGAAPATALPSPQTGPPASGDGRSVDLAAGGYQTRIYGRAEGDLRSDIPGLAAADFNGDGVDDLAIGARFADPAGRTEAGEVYILLGAGTLPAQVDTAQGQQDVTVLGAVAGGGLGFSLAAADLNGDGLDDLAIGAPFAATQSSSTGPGIVYLIFGRPDLDAVIDLSSAAAGVTIGGPSASAFFGDSLATGDVNGDGTDDLVVGATFAQRVENGRAGGPQSGAAYVLFGREDWQASLDAAQGGYDAALFGEEHLDEVGDTVAVGDINGDGYADVIATAEAADGPDNERPVAGEVFVMAGSRDLAGDHLAGQDDVLIHLTGAETNDTLGFDLAAGDLNGDGFSDLAMSARLAGGPNNSLGSAGELYVLYGSGDPPAAIDLASPQDQVGGLFAPDAGDLLGKVLIADLGQGMQLLAGASFADGPGNGRGDGGEVHVLNSPQAGTFGPLAAASQRAYYGAAAGDRLGSSFAIADLTGNGAPELIIVAADADPSPSQVDFGVVYVLAAGP